MSNRLFRYADLMDEKYKIFVNAIKIRPERKQPHGILWLYRYDDDWIG